VKQAHRDLWSAGDMAAFEYHCLEAHHSADAELWYRSRSPVTVIGLDPDGEAAVAASLIERAEAGMPLTYIVRFPDGHEAGVFEDELLTHERHFSAAHTPGTRPSAIAKATQP
jgi:hypothetical protein